MFEVYFASVNLRLMKIEDLAKKLFVKLEILKF
jgi:hypothetical protein